MCKGKASNSDITSRVTGMPARGGKTKHGKSLKTQTYFIPSFAYDSLKELIKCKY